MNKAEIFVQLGTVGYVLHAQKELSVYLKSFTSSWALQSCAL